MNAAKIEVAIVVPPFASAAMPMLGPSLLKARLQERGMAARVVYSNLVAARTLGVLRYQAVAESDVRLLHGELLSAVSGADWLTPARARLALKSLPDELASQIPLLERALENSIEEIASLAPAIVGFSSTFQQNIASILLARALRGRLPSAKLVIGGANVDAPMGDAFENAFPDAFDHVFSGEADQAFPDYCESVIGTARSAGTHDSPVAPPDFSDFYLQGGEEAQLAIAGERIIPIETSRGCWWGEKHHCSFCGLNANNMAYRARHPDQVRAEIETLVSRHSPDLVFAADNILSRATLKGEGGLPSGRGLGFRYFFESKSNLGDADLDMMVDLGIGEIQPGIESLSTNTLVRLRKGNSGPQHIRLLREASSRQIKVHWNLLVDVPGDDADTYEEMAAVIPLLTHLQPPSGCTPIRIDRYSPYFDTPQLFGVEQIRAIEPFSLIFGDLPGYEDFCYFFEADYVSGFRSEPSVAERLTKAVDAWRDGWANPQRHRSMVGMRNRHNEYVIVEQIGSQVPRVTILASADERLLLRMRRPIPHAGLSEAEREQINPYLELGVVALFEGHFIFLPSEPWRGMQLRAAPVRASIHEEERSMIHA